MPLQTGVPNTWTSPLASCQIFLKPIAAAVTPGCSDFWEHWSQSLADTKIIKVNKKQPISNPQTITHVILQQKKLALKQAQFWIKWLCHFHKNLQEFLDSAKDFLEEKQAWEGFFCLAIQMFLKILKSSLQWCQLLPSSRTASFLHRTTLLTQWMLCARVYDIQAHLPEVYSIPQANWICKLTGLQNWSHWLMHWMKGTWSP